jgi:hypothetical protein
VTGAISEQPQPNESVVLPSLQAKELRESVSGGASELPIEQLVRRANICGDVTIKRKPDLASKMSVMLQTPSRASTASSSSFQPISRQNTMSSHDGSRSARQSKRYSMSALYMSMSANETDLEIDDELAKGKYQYMRLSGGFHQCAMLILLP